MSEQEKYLVEVRNLKQYFPIATGFMKTTPLKAVDDVSFNIRRGETFFQRTAKAQLIHAAVGDEEHGGNGLFAQQGRDVVQMIELHGFSIGENGQHSAERKLISTAEKSDQWIHIMQRISIPRRSRQCNIGPISILRSSKRCKGEFIKGDFSVSGGDGQRGMCYNKKSL